MTDDVRAMDMSVAERCAMIGAQYPGWRIGRGGSGRWWAVRGTECLWATTPGELSDQLERHAP